MDSRTALLSFAHDPAGCRPGSFASSTVFCRCCGGTLVYQGRIRRGRVRFFVCRNCGAEHKFKDGV